MLVTCLACRSPVFVSASAVASGSAEVQCAACQARLAVASGGAASLLASAPVADQPPADIPVLPEAAVDMPAYQPEFSAAPIYSESTVAVAEQTVPPLADFSAFAGSFPSGVAQPPPPDFASAAYPSASAFLDFPAPEPPPSTPAFVGPSLFEPAAADAAPEPMPAELLPAAAPPPVLELPTASFVLPEPVAALAPPPLESFAADESVASLASAAPFDAESAPPDDNPLIVAPPKPVPQFLATTPTVSEAAPAWPSSVAPAPVAETPAPVAETPAPEPLPVEPSGGTRQVDPAFATEKPFAPMQPPLVLRQAHDPDPALAVAAALDEPVPSTWYVKELPKAQKAALPAESAANEAWSVPVPSTQVEPTFRGNVPQGVNGDDDLPRSTSRVGLVVVAAAVVLGLGGLLYAAGYIGPNGRVGADSVASLMAVAELPEPESPQRRTSADPGKVLVDEDPEEASAAAGKRGNLKKLSKQPGRKTADAGAKTGAAPPEPPPPPPLSATKTPVAPEPRASAQPKPPPAKPVETANGDVLVKAAEHYRQGNLYLNAKKVGLAIEEFNRALGLDAKYGVAYRSLGVAYMLLGREKSAMAAYEKFVALEPGHKDAPRVRQIIDGYRQRQGK